MKKKQAAKSRKPAKKAVILGRIQFKSDPRKVQYVVLSSDGVMKYRVSVFDGVVQACNRDSRSYCYHKKDCQIFEENRREAIERPAAQGDKNYQQALVEKLDGQYAGDPR